MSLLKLNRMLNSACLYTDWALTVVVTVVCIAIFFWPIKRLHPTASILLAFFFLCYAFQYYLLEFAPSQLDTLKDPEKVMLSIPAMALGGVLLLCAAVWIAEWIIVAIVVMMLAQTSDYAISIPIAVVIGFFVWVFLTCSGWANIKHIFMIALLGSANITIGLGAMILETSVAINNLPFSCQQHFNMFLTCDADCGTLLLYSNPAVRVGLVVTGLTFMLIRILAICFCCDGCDEKPELKSSCLFCDAIDLNQDSWIKSSDRDYARLSV